MIDHVPEEAARHYIESRRWPNGPRCPVCRSERIGVHSPDLYRCNVCREVFSVRTGTVMERSKIALTKWLHAIYLLVTVRKAISSAQLGRQLRIRQASAWFLLHCLREARGKNLDLLRRDRLDRDSALDVAVAALLAAKPKPRTRQAKRRARRQRKIQQRSIAA